MRDLLFTAFAAACLGYAALRGGRDERHLALLYAVGMLLTWVLVQPLGLAYRQMDLGTFVADALLWVGCLAIAVRSGRWIIIVIAGCAGVPVLLHLSRLLALGVPYWLYYNAFVLWSYVILGLIAGAAALHSSQRRRSAGAS